LWQKDSKKSRAPGGPEEEVGVPSEKGEGKKRVQSFWRRGIHSA